MREYRIIVTDVFEIASHIDATKEQIIKAYNESRGDAPHLYEFNHESIVVWDELGNEIN